MAGMFIGAAAAGTFADKFGRKRALYIWVPILSVILLCQAFVTSLPLLIALRTLAMIIAHMAWIPHISYCVEIVGPRGRSMAGCTTQIGFAIGYGLSSLLGYLFPDWRELTVAMGLCIGLCVLTIFLVPASFRFMYASGQYEEARKSLKVFAAKTGAEGIDDEFIDMFESEMKRLNGKNSNAKTTFTTIDLFTNGKKLAMVSVIQSMSFFTCSLVYYGMTLNAADLPGDLYINNFIGAVIEVVANA